MKNWYNLIPYTFFCVIVVVTVYCVMKTVFFSAKDTLQEGFSEGNEIRVASCIYYLESVPSFLASQNPAPPLSDAAAIRDTVTEMLDTLNALDQVKGPVTEETYKTKLMPVIEDGLHKLYGHSSLPLPSGSEPAGLLASLVDPSTHKRLTYYYLLPGMTQMYDMLANKLTMTGLNTY